MSADAAPAPQPDGAPPERVEEALALARALGLDRIDALALLAHHLGRPRSWLLAHADAALPADAAAALARDLHRRADQVPLAYLTGSRGFHGLDLQVGPAVLDPRPDTETLVDWALQLLGVTPPHAGGAVPPSGPRPAHAAAGSTALAAVVQPLVLDLGTGSGAVALAIAHACPRAVVHASDADPAALAMAAANARRLGLSLRSHRGRWWDAAQDLPPLHLALSNPPYLAADDPHLPALRHEPRHALVPASGGALDDLFALVDGAPAHLAAGGWLLLEHGHDQGEAVAGRLQQAGFEAIGHRHDLAGLCRCTGGRWPG
jgi:release factor glutamine methyltransferase